MLEFPFVGRIIFYVTVPKVLWKLCFCNENITFITSIFSRNNLWKKFFVPMTSCKILAKIHLCIWNSILPTKPPHKGEPGQGNEQEGSYIWLSLRNLEFFFLYIRTSKVFTWNFYYIEEWNFSIIFSRISFGDEWKSEMNRRTSYGAWDSKTHEPCKISDHDRIKNLKKF